VEIFNLQNKHFVFKIFLFVYLLIQFLIVTSNYFSYLIYLFVQLFAFYFLINITSFYVYRFKYNKTIVFQQD